MDARRTIATLSAAALLAGSLSLPVFAVADSASVTVTFRVSPSVTAQAVDDGLLIRSNAPWTLTAQTAEGAVSVSGPATGSKGALVEMDALAGYSLVLDTPR